MTIPTELLLSAGVTLSGVAAMVGYVRSQVQEISRRTTQLEEKKADKEVMTALNSGLQNSLDQVLKEISHLQDLVRHALGGSRDS